VRVPRYLIADVLIGAIGDVAVARCLQPRMDFWGAR
jgi:hypothetical protein